MSTTSSGDPPCRDAVEGMQGDGPPSMEESASTMPLRAGQQPAPGAWLARGIAAVAGIIFFAALPTRLGWATRSIAAWDLAVLVLVCEGCFVILRSDPARARERAVAEDPGRAALLAVAFGASVISLLAAVVVITQTQIVAPDAPVSLRNALGITAIVGAWTLLHTAYTLHYARLYYADREMAGSLEFLGGPPDDADFAYFAFGIGMTFQVPDVRVTHRRMRRVVLFHQLISFAYNTAILGLIVNLLAGRLSL